MIKKGQTTPDVEEIFIPEKARQQYCITSIICDENGTLYYKNDSACVMAVASSEAYMTGVTSSAEGSTIDNGVAFDGKLSSHDIVVLTSADKTTLTFTASEEQHYHRWRGRKQQRDGTDRSRQEL